MRLPPHFGQGPSGRSWTIVVPQSPSQSTYRRATAPVYITPHATSLAAAVRAVQGFVVVAGDVMRAALVALLVIDTARDARAGIASNQHWSVSCWIGTRGAVLALVSL